MKIEHEIVFDIDFLKSYTLESTKGGGVYFRYLSDEEVYQEQLADLSGIIDDKISQMKKKYC